MKDFTAAAIDRDNIALVAVCAYTQDSIVAVHMHDAAPAAILDLFVESPRRIMWGGGFLGAALASASVFLSNALNVQTGALIVILFGLLYLGALLLSPRHGVLAHLLRHPMAPHG